MYPCFLVSPIRASRARVTTNKSQTLPTEVVPKTTVLSSTSFLELGAVMDNVVVEKFVAEVQELTLSELAEVAGGMGDAAWV
jgi:hypothetical protein